MKPMNNNIHSLACAAISLFIVSLVAAPVNLGAAQDDAAILQKITTTFLNEALTSSSSIEELASRAGVSVEELRQICTSLGIDISRFTPRTEPLLAHTVEMLTSGDYEPEAIIEVASNTPYVILVEKKTHTVFLLKYEQGRRDLVAMYDCKTGKEAGDKYEKGDLKTPEGIYYLQEKLSRDSIVGRVGNGMAFQYGEIAFTSDYPNSIDRLNKKTGNGIWLHGTDEDYESTPSLDTNGCVVTTNETIRELAQYITTGRTPFVIVEELTFLPKAEHERLKQEYLNLLWGWRDAWQAEKIDSYMSFYSPDFRDRDRDIARYRDYKKNVFSAFRVRNIELTDIIILKHPQGVVMQFFQDYSASNLNSRNVKSLYLVNQDASWKIVSEEIH